MTLFQQKNFYSNRTTRERREGCRRIQPCRLLSERLLFFFEGESFERRKILFPEYGRNDGIRMGQLPGQLVMTRPDRSIEGKGGYERYFMNYYVAMTKRIHFGQHELGIHW